MNPDDVSYSTVALSVILALIAAAVPVTIAYLLNRKNANKKLQLDETTVMIAGTAEQVAVYKDLLDRANKAVEKAEANNTLFAKKIEELEEQTREQDWKITTLRNLFQRVVNRSNITLSHEEEQIFDSTKPMNTVRKFRRPGPPKPI